MTDNPRAAIGGNAPPLDDADRLKITLETEFEDLSDEVMNLDAARLQLPSELKTDEDCGKVVKWIADLKKLGGTAEKKRKAKGEPYLAAQRTINSWFSDLTKELDEKAKALERSVGAYNRAKAERERAEKLERERQERARAEAARQEEQRAREAADAAARAAEEAAARIRQAGTVEERETAAAEMRQADAQAEILRDEAEGLGATAAKAERKADSAGRQAEGDVGKLSRIATEGATSSVTAKWAATIVDWSALRRSLGPLAMWLNDKDIEAAVHRAVRECSAGGRTPELTFPGVEIAQEFKTNIRAARGA